MTSWLIIFRYDKESKEFHSVVRNLTGLSIGAFQDSIIYIGSLLFVLYINDLPIVVKHSFWTYMLMMPNYIVATASDLCVW